MKIAIKLPILSFFLVFVANCANSEPLSQRVHLGNGMAPYEGSDKVELCLQGAALSSVQTSSDVPLGLCVPENAQAASCTENADCTSREACVCGRCVLSLCEFSSECATGHVCVGSPSRCAARCFDHGDCPSSHQCEQGACIPNCGDENDCAFGELCLVGQCVALGCGRSPGICAQNERCDVQRSLGSLSQSSVKQVDDELVLYALLQDENKQKQLVRGLATHAKRFELQYTEGVDVSEWSEDSSFSFGTQASGLRIYYAKVNQLALYQSESEDGLGFTHEQVLLKPSFAWHGARLHSPATLDLDAHVWLFYLNDDGSCVGLYRFDEHGVIEHHEQPVLCAEWLNPESPNEPSLWKNVAHLRDPYALLFSSTFGKAELRLFFSAEGQERLGDSADAFSLINNSIGVATWTWHDPIVERFSLTPFAYNPVLARRGNLKELPEYFPSVVKVKQAWLMYFSDGAVFRVAEN